MINKEFALGTYELQLLSKLDRQYIFQEIKSVANYIDTAINYNVDYCLPTDSSYKIISKIASCHFNFYDLFVDNHLKCLGREKIDIMLIHSNRGDWSNLAKRMIHDDRFEHVGVSNFRIDDLLEYKQLLGVYPEYNEIEINPSYVDIDTIQFCQEHDIKIIAYCILGGKYNAKKFVSVYSLPYLVAFAANYADIVIIKPESITQTDDFINAILYYDSENISFDSFTNDKIMNPMQYDPPTIIKEYGYIHIYSLNCGQNHVRKFKSAKSIEFDFPEFEMLGDYATYLRYLFKRNYLSDCYDYEFLLADDGFEYAIQLYDEHGNLTKVNNKNTTKILLRLEKA